MPSEADCPFCGATGSDARCASCGREVGATRRICSCGRATPASEKACVHCGRRGRSDLRWKIPLIVALFAAATALGLALRLMD